MAGSHEDRKSTENEVRATVDSLMEGIDGFLAAKTVVGEPIRISDTTIIPLADVSFALGAGAFGGEGQRNGGGGAGGRMTPCAVLIIQNGAARIVNIKNQDGMAKLLEMVPDFIGQFSGGSDGGKTNVRSEAGMKGKREARAKDQSKARAEDRKESGADIKTGTTGTQAGMNEKSHPDR